MSAEQIILENDLETAIEKYNTTTPRWKNHWWEAIEKIFNQSAKWAKEYIIDPINKVIRKIEKTVAPILTSATGNWFYLMRFYNDGKLVFSKIGTTERTVQKRLSEHIRYYNTHNCPVDNVIVDRIYNCGNTEPECYESYFRAHYIMKHPGTYIKNDRFFNVEFDLNEADEIYNELMSKCSN